MLVSDLITEMRQWPYYHNVCRLFLKDKVIKLIHRDRHHYLLKQNPSQMEKYVCDLSSFGYSRVGLWDSIFKCKILLDNLFFMQK